MEQNVMRTSSVRAVDERGDYHDVDFFTAIDDGGANLGNAKTREYSLRVNRQAAKQVDADTYEVIATGLRLRRVSPAPKV